MNKLLDSAGIALSAIWAAKLRSLMTVLGNIVAVTSIIAVVSLIQGLNQSVKSAILNQAGADSFNIQQFPITRSDDEFEKVRGNPRMTLQDARAVRRYSSLAAAEIADSTSQGPNTNPDKSIDQTKVQGVTGEYVNFSSFDAERGRLMSPTEVETARPVTVIGWQTADRLFGTEIDPIGKTIQIEGVHFQVVGVSAKRGTFLGQSQDEFGVIPLQQFQAIFGSRPQLSVTVKPRDLAQIAQTMDEATVGLRIQRRLKPKQPSNFGMFTSDTLLDLYHSATNGIFAVLIGVVALSLVVGGIVIMNIMLMVVTNWRNIIFFLINIYIFLYIISFFRRARARARARGPLPDPSGGPPPARARARPPLLIINKAGGARARACGGGKKKKKRNIYIYIYIEADIFF